jgi:hypothetical protein
MNNYKGILILHAIDESTLFLNKFKKEFNSHYKSFDTKQKSIDEAKSLLGSLEPRSLIIFLGHGSSSELYEPDDTHKYEKHFLDATWGNHYFEEHDVFLLSCRSNEYLKKIHTSNYSIGFGNIISSKEQLDHDNKYKDKKKSLNKDEINIFNQIYLDISIKVLKRLLSNKITFKDLLKSFRFFLNKEINNILLNKDYQNRLELSRLLYEFRDEITFKIK